MPFFDFHCHPGLKPTFANQSAAPSVWKFINAKLAVFQNVEISINPLFNEVLNSQSCLEQLYKGNVKLVGIALHAPEAAMAKGLLQKKLVNKGSVLLIDPKRLELIADGKHYFEFLNAELHRLTNTLPPPDMAGVKFKILKKAADFNEADANSIYGFLIIEGLHCFLGDPDAPNAKELFNNNFEKFTDEHTVIAINPCHIQMAPFCNHAYGIQFISDRRFLPTGNGITDWGREMIKRIIDKNILIDIKHMSLWSRWQLYSMMRDTEDDNKYSAPILCTHAGVTGLSTRDRVKYLYRKPLAIDDVYEVAYLKPKSPYINGTYFNCSSINLYDEDIEAILLSGGLIGLSFDQRIIGFADENVLRGVTIPNDVEYISQQEANFFLGPNPGILPPWKDDSKIWNEDFENLDPSLNMLLHPLFFLNQVLHILTVAKNHQHIGIAKALKQICLGSDYDGLINSIDNCKQIDQLETFKQLVLEKLPVLLSDARLANDGIDVHEFADDLFYNNGRNFIVSFLKELAK